VLIKLTTWCSYPFALCVAPLPLEVRNPTLQPGRVIALTPQGAVEALELRSWGIGR